VRAARLLAGDVSLTDAARAAGLSTRHLGLVERGVDPLTRPTTSTSAMCSASRASGSRVTGRRSSTSSTTSACHRHNRYGRNVFSRWGASVRAAHSCGSAWLAVLDGGSRFRSAARRLGVGLELCVVLVADDLGRKSRRIGHRIGEAL
jgi:hypothetical protein